MLGTVRQVLGPGHPDVEDVTQEAVIAFLRALPQFRGDCTTLSYAQRVALFTALAARRRLVAQRRLVDADEAPEEVPASELKNPHAEALASRRRDVIRKLMDQLPSVIAEALALHFILGYTVDEIALSTGTLPNTVWSRLRLGKHALRKRLARNSELAELLEVPE